MANPIQMFIDIALSHKGENGTWARSLSGLGGSDAFCAGFIVACGRTLEQQTGLQIIGNIIFYSVGALNITTSSSNINGVYISNPGTWINGPMLGNIGVPCPGDIICYRYPSNYHVGIVRGVYNGTVYTMEGNVTYIATGQGHMCDTRERSLSDSTIYAYCRPNWGVVGGSYTDIKSVVMNSSNQSNVAYSVNITPAQPNLEPSENATIVSPQTMKRSDGSIIHKQTIKTLTPETVEIPELPEPAELISKSLYETTNTAEDAILREVCYIDKNGNKNLSNNGVRLSVINYTSWLSALIRSMDSAYYYFDNKRMNTDLLEDSKSKVVMRYLLDKGFNATQAIGLFSVIWKLSNFQADLMDSSKNKYGLLAWSKSDIVNVVKSCGTNWYNNLTGQLNYIWEDMTLNRKDFIESMENEVLTNDKKYIDKSVELSVKEYISGLIIGPTIESCTVYGRMIYEKIIVEDDTK